MIVNDRRQRSALHLIMMTDQNKKAHVISAMEGYSRCTSFTQARQEIQEWLISNDFVNSGDSKRLFNSVTIPFGASSKPISDGDLAIQTRLVNRRYTIMDLIELSGDRDADRASLAVICVTIGSTISALVATQSLPGPEIARFVVVWILSFAPLALVGYGITDVEKVQSLLVTIQRIAFPAYRQRMVQHEAGHFLMGYLLGYPIKGYRANAVKNAVEFFPFADKEKGAERARQLGFDAVAFRSTATSVNGVVEASSSVPFFSKEGRGRSAFERSVLQTPESSVPQLDTRDDPSAAWPYRGFSDFELDQLAAISVAGVCSEILSFGNAEGGLADLNQLRQIFNAAESPLSERDCENRIRFSLALVLTQLRRYLGVLDSLAAVMERGGSVEECISCIETCVDVSGQDGIQGDYELRRRQKIRSQTTNVIENVFLSGGSDIDAAEDRFVEGKGGGYRKRQRFRLTGDDPLYAAVAVSLCFLLWASTGGMSLH
jgi:hypothetical protein